MFQKSRARAALQDLRHGAGHVDPERVASRSAFQDHPAGPEKRVRVSGEKLNDERDGIPIVTERLISLQDRRAPRFEHISGLPAAPDEPRGADHFRVDHPDAEPDEKATDGRYGDPRKRGEPNTIPDGQIAYLHSYHRYRPERPAFLS